MMGTQIETNAPSFQYSIGERFQNDKRHIFAACTSNLKLDNEIHVIEFQETEQKIQVLDHLKHPGMIDKLIPNPQNESQLYAIFSEVQNASLQKKLSLIQLDLQHTQDGPKEASIVFDLSIQRELQNVIPNTKEPKIYIADQKSINTYDINTQSFANVFGNDETQGNYSFCEIDPYHPNLFCRVHDEKSIHIQDIRDKKNAYVIEKAHNLQILDLDFNPNKQYYFLTAGEDCAVKIWDLRKFQYPMKSINDFQNSPLSAKFNKFHDQLIAISFDDGTIMLYRATSVSSVPLITQMNYHASTKEEDAIVKSYDEHEDSIYSVAWSHSTAWVFASIANNSNIIVNMVPTAEKYKILL